MELNFYVNRIKIKLDISPKKRLLDILRDDLDLIGTKEGCGKGECGACTVLMNGVRINSCLVPAFQLQNANIVTVEGLKGWETYSEVESAFIEQGAVQCGFCFPGFVMSSISFLKETSSESTEKQIKNGLGGNICRCTGHTKIIEAIQKLSTNSELINRIQMEWNNVFDR